VAAAHGTGALPGALIVVKSTSRLRSGNQLRARTAIGGRRAMREEFGWQHKKAKRVADWSPAPDDPRPVGPWRYLPAVAIGAALFGVLAGLALIQGDAQRRDRLQRWVAMTSDVPPKGR
jgi:hypothetical protein